MVGNCFLRSLVRSSTVQGPLPWDMEGLLLLRWRGNQFWLKDIPPPTCAVAGLPFAITARYDIARPERRETAQKGIKSSQHLLVAHLRKPRHLSKVSPSQHEIP